MKIIFVILSALISVPGMSQFTDVKELKVPAEKVLYLPNINGSIKVIADERSDIMISYNRELKASGQDIPENVKSMVVLKSKIINDTILVFIDGICGSGKWKNTTSNISRSTYYTEDCRDEFKFKFDIELHVPKNQNLDLSTINDGDIIVNEVQGTLNLHNVNGSIKVSGASGMVRARTINGDVDIDFSRTPDSGSYYTLNGDINMNLPRGFSTSATFKSFNGDIYTNVPDVRQEPMMTKKEEKGKGTSFRAELNTMITIRDGGGLLEIETFNGNAYIREN